MDGSDTLNRTILVVVVADPLNRTILVVVVADPLNRTILVVVMAEFRPQKCQKVVLFRPRVAEFRPLEAISMDFDGIFDRRLSVHQTENLELLLNF